MDYDTKVSHSVKSAVGHTTGTSNSEKAILPHLLTSLALPYLFGARTQLTRYQEAASGLQTRTIPATYECLHEISCLFEDLVTISKYIKRCGEKHILHRLWLDVRNHIRHDIREELDNETEGEKTPEPNA